MAEIKKGDTVWLRLDTRVEAIKVEKVDGSVLTGTQPKPLDGDPPVVIDLAEGWAVEHKKRS